MNGTEGKGIKKNTFEIFLSPDMSPKNETQLKKCEQNYIKT